MAGINYYNSFINELISKVFAKLCFENFGDRVKYWVTLNEPYTVSHHGYAVGCHAPGRCSAWQNLNCTGGDSGTEPYLVTHHQLLAHAAALSLMGSLLANRLLQIGYIYPKGIYDLVHYTKEKYNDPIIYITENGVDEFNDPKIPLEQALNDTYRIDFYYRHLCYLHAAMREGAKVKGYFAWSLLDNFEWNDGYTVRFGIIYVDYNKGVHYLQRYLKRSAEWFKNFLKK
ncbi:hypothetical protein Pyn_36360 [Prunus yedoensis var. nudiflora]|uniref:Beta-glucosidase 12-like n=1 Tax=Prunus yedoensis var. nudiflora TaxID=2094558 RepID=A0A314UP07_PRUYE|nr:hypothetical protein Pyn_36360 [Prunus yedoensis var. nudiflora]